MKYLFLAASAIVTSAIAIPTPSDDPIRILPLSWEFQIQDLKGPGCPDLNSDKFAKTRHNHGENTLDGSEIYYNVFAYPYMKAEIPQGEISASTWCETTLKYIEHKGQAADYRLKPHKNGTFVGAVYNLDEGVKAEWTFTYDTPSEKKIVDVLSISGPVQNRRQSEYFLYAPNPVSEQWKAPECGNTVIKFRTDLTVTADKPGKKGIATSETIKGENGETLNYGTWLGISFDWEKCTA